MTPHARKQSWCKFRWLVVVATSLASVISFNTVVLVLVSHNLEETSSTFQGRIDSDSHDSVHVVTTRFMQHQPSLLALGHARLELFKSVCLPTMLCQDTSDFIWLILIDPHLHPELFDELRQLIEPHKNFFLIRNEQTNVNLKTLNPSLVETGDIELLYRAARLLSSSILIQTRLDVDDGLARDLLRTVKEMAVQRLSQVSKSPNGWVAYCIHRHLEWHSYAKDHTAGGLILVKRMHCVTPGLSFALAPDTDHSQLTSASHEQLHGVIPPCLTGTQTACLHRLEEIAGPIAIRGRTPTSAGMTDIGRDYNEELSSLPVFWQSLQENFCISLQSLMATKQYLENHVAEIARDNLQGQCTKGHSCKDVSKKQLQKLVNESATIEA